MLEVEKEELTTRAKALSTEEQILFLKEMPSSLLFDELSNRMESAERKIQAVEDFIKKGEEK